MAKTETVQVSKKGQEGVQLSYSFPEALDDPRWQEIVSDYPADVNALAVAAFRVRLQAAVRPELENGAEAVEKAATEYTYNKRREGTRKRKARVTREVQEKGKFSKQQLALLQEAGYDVEGMEAA